VAALREDADEAEVYIMAVLDTPAQPRSTTKREGVQTCGLIETELGALVMLQNVRDSFCFDRRNRFS
jgi:hypothetical protein